MKAKWISIVPGLLLFCALRPSLLQAAPSCPGSAPEEILASFNKTWGNVGDRGITPKESENIYEGLLDYYICRAIGRKTLDACQPGDVIPAYGVHYSLGYRCRDRRLRYSFFDFLARPAGGNSAASCRNYFDFMVTAPARMDKAVRATTEQFCGAAAKAGRMGNLCSALKRAGFLSMSMDMCRTVFPIGLADCDKEDLQRMPDCRLNLELFRAISSGKADLCPDVSCKTFIDPSSTPDCSEAARKLADVYCGLSDAAQKRMMK